MDWHSHWIGKHVLVQNIYMHGSYYASLYSDIGCVWWYFAAFLPTINFVSNLSNMADFAFWFDTTAGGTRRSVLLYVSIIRLIISTNV